MKTITQILNEMILENKKEIEELKKEVNKTQKNCQEWIDRLNHYQNQDEIILKKLIKKIKKITIILSISIILNSISIILINLWR